MDVLRCPRCWKPLPAGAAFCRRCGRALEPFTTPQSATFVPPLPAGAAAPARRPVRRGPSPLLVVLAVVAIIAAVLRSGRVKQMGCPVEEITPATVWESPAPRPDEVEADANEPAAPRGPSAAREPALAPHVAPRIEWISTGRVDVGVPLVIRGRGLDRTRQVLFVGLTDGRRHEVRFDARRDDLLYAAVPDMGLVEQDLAVVIVTPGGAAVAAGRGRRGARRVAFVDDGQTAVAAGDHTLFVRRGGVVLGRGSDDTCRIFREADVPATILGAFPGEIDVPSLDVRLLDTPLHYDGG